VVADWFMIKVDATANPAKTRDRLRVDRA